MRKIGLGDNGNQYVVTSGHAEARAVLLGDRKIKLNNRRHLAPATLTAYKHTITHFPLNSVKSGAGGGGGNSFFLTNKVKNAQITPNQTKTRKNYLNKLLQNNTYLPH